MKKLAFLPFLFLASLVQAYDGGGYYFMLPASSVSAPGAFGGGAGGPAIVAFSTNTSADASGNFVYSHTFAANTNLAVIACGSSQSGAFSSAAINGGGGWLGMEMSTKSARLNFGAAYSVIWTATGVVAGAYTIATTKSSDVGDNTLCVTYDISGANQATNGITLPPGHGEADAVTSVSTTTASNSGELVIDAGAIGPVVTGFTTDAGQTLRVNTSASLTTFWSSTKSGSAGTTAMGGDWTGLAHGEVCAISVH